MTLNSKQMSINILLRSKDVSLRQRGQQLSLQKYEQTQYLVEKISNCNPNQPCNTSACNFCGNRFPKHKSAASRDGELRARPKSKVHQSYDEHPEIWNAAPAKLNKYAPKAAAQLLTNFENQFWLDHIQHFTLNYAIIPFDHNEIDFVLGNYKDSSNCLSAEVRAAILKAKPEIRQIFYYLNDAPFYGIFESTIVELDGNPLWETQKRKWAELRSGCQYGILIHIHGVFAGATKKQLKKACERFGYGGIRQTAIGELLDQYEDGEYLKGGIGGWGEYIEKNEFKSFFGDDTDLLYAIHEHVRKQVGRSLIRHHHLSYKPLPLVRTWECIDPKDFTIFDEMQQDYQEHYVYPFLPDDDYETEPNEPSYDEIFPEEFQQYHNQDSETQFLTETEQELEERYNDYLEQEDGIKPSYNSEPGTQEHVTSSFFNFVNWINELCESFNQNCSTWCDHSRQNNSNLMLCQIGCI